MSEKVHKILRRDVMPDGTEIQLEDWKEVYPTIFKTIFIGAYPIAKNDSYWIRRNESFRFTISNNFNSDAEVEDIYNGLINGNVKLEDIAEHFSDGLKAKYYLGIETEGERERLARSSANECLYFHLPKSAYKTYGLSKKRAEEIWNEEVAV